MTLTESHTEHLRAQAEERHVRHVQQLVIELEGERKANALLTAGMESIVERMDALKHENRVLRELVEKLGDRILLCAEILGRLAERKEAK